MDELHDAIQDAQYIGAVTNSQRGPSAAFYNPSANELTQFVDRQERALGSDWLGLENLLDMPLGFYFFRRFCEAEQHGSRKLDFLVEVTKYRTLQTPEQRAGKAREIWDLFFGSATPGDTNATTRESGVTVWSPVMRGEARLHQSPISPMTATSTSEYSTSIAMPGGSTATGTGMNLHSPPVGRPSPTRMSLGCLDELNVASMTTNGIVFWRKNESSVSRADVRSVYSSASTEASPVGVGGDVVLRLSTVFKRKQFPVGTESERGDSMNCVRDGSPTMAASPTASTVSTSELNDLGMENRPESASSRASNQRIEKRSSLESKISSLPLFDELEACVLCSLEQFHMKDFRSSAFYKRLIAFLFLQKRRVNEEDFTVLRVLGRGGFDWWSYGCLVYELLYGKCPFRTSKAKALHEDKQQAYDKATLELTPAYDSKYFSPDAAELIQQLLIRDPTKRLGAKGAEEVKRMRFFSSIDWAAMEQMQISPPFVPDNEINAASQADIGSFDISVVKGIKLSEQEQAAYSGWDYVCPETFQREAVEYLVWEVKHGPCTIGANNNSCCSIL
ncbi:G protein-coupled receptor kinase 1 [Phytophthora ramorum]|uniref:G protein-coupled receptor kinase 1 n=1 Tax=Phytophthora ramorum TaxID=164328 RepID=UPI0030B1C96B|nr:G protein-coupled receptor kinase 1 [Phytophthora ramorum]